MPFIDNVKFKEILNASRNGNDKAKVIVQSMRKNGTQEDLDRLVNDYYGLIEPGFEDVPQVEFTPTPEEVTMSSCEECVQPELEPEIIDAPEHPEEVQDLSSILDGETEGLFDEADFEDMSFGDYIKNKKSDANRMKKNGDYFKSFDLQGRTNYMNGKIDAYKSKFDGNLRDIERSFNDTDKALNSYLQNATDSLDDEFELDQDKASSAYNDFTDNDIVMHSFGRYWDNDDNAVIVQALQELMAQYGKKNVIAALNILKSDNEGRRNFLNNQIDTNIGKYSKSVEKLFK